MTDRTPEEVAADVEALVKELGPARWSTTVESPVGEHVDNFREMLEKAQGDEPAELHWLSTADGRAICIVGVTEKSSRIARTLEGLWNFYLEEISECRILQKENDCD